MVFLKYIYTFLPSPWQLTCELTVVVGAGRVLLVGAERRAGRWAGAEAGVAQGRADLAGLAAVVHRPLDVQGGRQGGALLGLHAQEGELCEKPIFTGAFKTFVSFLRPLTFSFRGSATHWIQASFTEHRMNNIHYCETQCCSFLRLLTFLTL